MISNVRKLWNVQSFFFFQLFFHPVYMVRITNDANRQKTGVLENLIITIKKRKLKNDMNTSQEATIFPLPSCNVPPESNKEEPDREKIEWQHHWEVWKILHRDPDTSMQQRHMEGAGHMRGNPTTISMGWQCIQSLNLAYFIQFSITFVIIVIIFIMGMCPRS